MNKRGEKNELVLSTVVYLVILLIFVVPLSLFVYSQKDGADVWQDFYAKEISRVVNLAEPGEVIGLDVHKGTEIGLKKSVPYSEMFVFNNKAGEICVSFSNTKSCYSYFNNVDVSDRELVLASGESGEVNILMFKIREREENLGVENE